MAKVSDELHFKPRLQVINEQQIERLHGATLELLERTGVKMTHPEALEILAGSGARVSGDRVRFPSWMVEDAIRKAPSRLVLGRRTGERTVFLEGDNTFFGPSLDCLDYLDPQTRKRSRFTSEHVKVTAALCDMLPGFEWCMTIGMAADVPDAIADRVVARNVMQNCRKPLVFCCNDLNSLKDIHDMALLICGGEDNLARAPYIVHYSEPISPLVYYDPAVDKIIHCARHNIPLINSAAPQLCGSAPATFAGTIVQGSAESLSGLVLHQLVSPGADFVYGAFATIMDMRTTVFSYGAAEISLMVGALAQMAQFYQLPFWGTGGASDAKFCDPQAAAEATQQIMASAGVGSGLVHDCGAWLDHGSLVSPEFLVLAAEIVDAVDHFMQGIPITSETLALDLIESVGPGGHYLATDHTANHYQNIRYSELFDRSVMDLWVRDGSKSFEQRLQELTLEKMTVTPAPLVEDIVAELDRMQAKWV